MSAYEVYVRVGSREWTFTESEGQIADGVTVLAGLSFDWSVPGPLWPQQPDPMGASLAINLPEFDAHTFIEDEVVAIEVKADVEGDVIASFYGTVADPKAVSRTGRGGVTMSLIGVDHTVRLAELENLNFETDGGREADCADLLWTVNPVSVGSQLGISGVFAEPPTGGIWTSLNRSMRAIAANVSVDTFLKGLLQQAVNRVDNTRMIVSPYVGDTGGLATSAAGRQFTLDTISGDLEHDEDPWTLSKVERDTLSWSIPKGGNPAVIVATGWGDEEDENKDTNRVYSERPLAPLETGTYYAFQVNLVLESDAQDTVDFYADHPFTDWQLDTLVVPVSRAGIGADVPLGLFPNWRLDEGDPGRAACYNRRIVVENVDATKTPDGQDTITGVLVGARCTINAGTGLELQLQLRRFTPTEGKPAAFVAGAWGGAPYAGMAPAS